MRLWALGFGLWVCAALAGEVGLPTEHRALPVVAAEGQFLVCIWDETAQEWQSDFVVYDHSGSYDFLVPAWGRWYWIGLWDVAGREFVYGGWSGHFKTE